MWKAMSINGFPIQILLPKSKEEWTEVLSRLLSIFVTHKLQENLNFSLYFLNFSELFQYIFILVSQSDVMSVENIHSIIIWKGSSLL